VVAVTLWRRDVAVAYVHLWGSSLFGLSSSASGNVTPLLTFRRIRNAGLAYAVLVWGVFMGVKRNVDTTHKDSPAARK
jgi:hypothetical protein